MARYMRPNHPLIYRAVIVVDYHDTDRVIEVFAGPYANEGAAQAAKTREARDYKRLAGSRPCTVASWVESSPLSWSTVATTGVTPLEATQH